MISLAIPNLTGNERKYLINCIDTTFVSSVGEYVTQFEKMVAEATGSRNAVATSSGTTGLHVALNAVGVKHGDLVILPTFTFIASANAVRHCGADPWLMDVDTSTWCLSPEVVASEIREHCEQRKDGLYHRESGKRVAALMPVYTLGNTPNMLAFRVVADKYNLPLIVDAACAIGATFNGQSFGSLAELSVLSFNGNKTITCGGGGAVVGNCEEQTELVRHLTTTARVWPDYDFDMVGFNYRMTNIQAAVGCAQMERLSSFVTVKRNIHQYYKINLEELTRKGITFFPSTEGSSCWFSGIVLPAGETLKMAKHICSLLKEDDIEARTFWKPVHLQKPYGNCPKSDISVSEDLWQRIVTLPCSTNITEEELAKVVISIKKIVGKLL
ncbi:aminotransferase class I/II-fold pyridoxal phosphate-dependent enzyme [Acetatifactor muris]|uniref:Pyridoxal phosphate-dependent aminotransferase EpsN n=1 Tax=Acetatifactor muris TaxID=879566 RepID=A0A2K4ZD33_9FIRM|nr:aminotransferase class I/II-fold pyridoxal phosphate-dependent enzyme [Acetatifactor muris]MCR2046779.1 aminotransferase class I/II-fold pyridoxal phosphate-dependent enzyme [Acetatifactor muris]SOY28373.1 Putative pyridoxal phosphate-dependent aminotransferase EpsN [Acetatifactor muris]